MGLAELFSEMGKDEKENRLNSRRLAMLTGKNAYDPVFNTKTKILITGINGMVASYLADRLILEGHEVIGTYRWQEDMSNIEHIKDKIKLIPMNLNDAWNVLRVIEEFKPDAISHLAAESYVSDSFSFPHEAINVNTLGTLNLLEAVRIVQENWRNRLDGDEFNIPLYNPIIHICSSSEVYGLVKKEDIPIKETQNFNPANPYAVGKVGADMLALMYYTNYGLKTIRTRMFTHTSQRRKMLSAEVNFARQIANFEKINKEEGITEFWLKHGNLDSIRTWAHVQDAVNAYYLVLTQPKKFGEVYNIGGLDSRTIGEVLQYLLSLADKNIYINTQLDETLLRKYDVTLQLPDISKFKSDYPEWKPKWKFEDIMKDVLKGQRERT